jgi:hypothetical protein
MEHVSIFWFILACFVSISLAFWPTSAWFRGIRLAQPRLRTRLHAIYDNALCKSAFKARTARRKQIRQACRLPYQRHQG